MQWGLFCRLILEALAERSAPPMAYKNDQAGAAPVAAITTTTMIEGKIAKFREWIEVHFEIDEE
jgi:hypothetical protein